MIQNFGFKKICFSLLMNKVSPKNNNYLQNDNEKEFQQFQSCSLEWWKHLFYYRMIIKKKLIEKGLIYACYKEDLIVFRCGSISNIYNEPN